MPIEQITRESPQSKAPNEGDNSCVPADPLVADGDDDDTSSFSPDRYPGWVRIAILIGGGGFLWIAAAYGILARIGEWLH